MELFHWEFLSVTLKDVIDIFVVSFLLYLFFSFLKGSRIVTMSIGIVFLALIWVVANLAGLDTLNFIFTKILSFGAILLIIVFQPELRATLIRIGNVSFFNKFSNNSSHTVIDEIVKSVTALQHVKMGALIVIERNVGLNDISHGGVIINADVTSDLMENIFFKDSPLHDGAVIIKEDKIIAASVVLPLEDIPQGFSDKYNHHGLRHRAGMGITKETDAVSIILSEESGLISVVEYSNIKPIKLSELKEVLIEIIEEENRFMV